MTGRREFLKRAALTGAVPAFAARVLEGTQAATAGVAKHVWHLRYAPRLDFLAKELTIPDRIALFAEHGFTATEYNGLMNLPLPEVEALRKTLDAHKIEMGIFVANPGGWKTAGMVEPAQHDAFLGEIKRAIEYHRVIGNRWATVISGSEIQGRSRARQRRDVVIALRRAAELLAPTNFTIVLEPLNPVDHPGYFFPRSDELAEVIAAVDSPRVRMLWDFYHLQVSEGNLIRNFREHYDLVGYIQTGDVPGRKEPWTGEVNWTNVFKAVHEKGYTGILGMEHGLSQQGRDGLIKCFDAYRRADSFEAGGPVTPAREGARQ